MQYQHRRTISSHVMAMLLLGFLAVPYAHAEEEPSTGYDYYRIGKRYDEGIGVAKNAAKAFACYRQAAELGDAAGQNALGAVYLLGLGVEQDERQGEFWIRMAAAQGCDAALNTLGYCYIGGRGVEKDIERGYGYIIRAAEHGLDVAMKNLAVAYGNDEGWLETDKSVRDCWVDRMIDQGLEEELYSEIIRILERRENTSDECIEELFERLHTLARHGHGGAMYSLGFCYYSGTGCEQNRREAVRWFERTAEKGVAAGCYAIGLLFLQGCRAEDGTELIPQNETIAWERITHAGELGWKEAIVCLYAHSGKRLQENTEDLALQTKYVYWLERLAETGEVEAMRELARRYAIGACVPRDFKQVVYWAKRGMEAGDPQCHQLYAALCSGDDGLSCESANDDALSDSVVADDPLSSESHGLPLSQNYYISNEAP